MFQKFGGGRRNSPKVRVLFAAAQDAKGPDAVMTFSAAVQSGLRNCLVFRGRASRSELWWFALFVLWLGAAAVFFVHHSGLEPLWAGLTVLVTKMFAPLLLLGVAVRRLHDCNLRGAWLLLAWLLSVGLAIAGGLLLGLPAGVTWSLLHGQSQTLFLLMLVLYPGTLCLLCLPPVLAWAAVHYVFVRKGTSGPNRYGPDPLESPLKDSPQDMPTRS